MFLLFSLHCRLLEDVDTSVVDVKVNKGRTEEITMFVDGSIFSKFPRVKVKLTVFKRGFI